MKIAAIDIGSNSIHMIIASVGAGSFEVLDRAKEMVGLGRGTLASGSLSATAMETGLRTLAAFRQLARRQGAERILAVATSAVREASNGGEFALRAWDELGIEIDVVTGAEEARLIFLAARHALDFRRQRVLVVDIGGGSVEIIYGEGNEIRWQESTKLGVVRLTERFIHSDPPRSSEVAALERHVDHVLAPAFHRVRRARLAPTLLVGTSGTLLNLTAMAAALRTGKVPARIHDRRLRAKDLERIRRLVLERDADEREKLPGLDRKRVDLIPAGVVLTDALLRGFGKKELHACDAALREGILLNFIDTHSDEVKAADRVPDVRRRSVLQLADRLGSDGAHGRHVAQLATDLFDATRAMHGLGKVDRELLEFAALLHDVGLYISHSKHHRHSHYLITHGDLRGFAPEEIQVVAALARFHKGPPPKTSHEELKALPADARRRVIELAAILRIADSLDRGHHGVVRKVRVSRRNGTMVVGLDTGGRDAALELWGAERKSDLWERRFGTEIVFRVSG